MSNIAKLLDFNCTELTELIERWEAIGCNCGFIRILGVNVVDVLVWSASNVWVPDAVIEAYIKLYANSLQKGQWSRDINLGHWGVTSKCDEGEAQLFARVRLDLTISDEEDPDGDPALEVDVECGVLIDIAWRLHTCSPLYGWPDRPLKETPFRILEQIIRGVEPRLKRDAERAGEQLPPYELPRPPEYDPDSPGDPVIDPPRIPWPRDLPGERTGGLA